MAKAPFFGRLLILVLGILVSSVAVAGEQSTFDSFYRPAWDPPLVFAAIGALVIAVLLYVGLFPVTGPVTVIGTSIGSMMGLSGAAATNAGLALLGGGSLVSGGFGVMGGAAVLAAAVSFGTDIVIDYAAGNVLNQYQYQQFAASSWKMMTLPLPKNTSGPPASVEEAGKKLDSNMADAVWACIKMGVPNSVSAFKNCLAGRDKPQRQRVRSALAVLNSYKSGPKMSSDSAERKSAMYALLHFLNNDYVSAKNSANKSYAIGLKAGHTPTLPAFISSASMLYDNRLDFNRSFSLFRYSVTAEPVNPLTPLLFSGYLDRLSYRLNDGAASLNEVDRIAKFSFTLGNDDRKLVIQQTLLSHYFMRLKVAQQRIISLTGTQNKSVLKNPRTLAVVKASLNDYERLLKSSKNLIDKQRSLLGSIFPKGSMWDDFTSRKNLLVMKITLNQERDLEKSIEIFSKAWAEYSHDQPSITQRVATFEKALAVLSIPAATTPPTSAQPKSVLDWIKWAVSMTKCKK